MSNPRPHYREPDSKLIEAEILNADDLLIATSDPCIRSLLQLASSAVDLVSRDLETLRQPRLTPALAGARSCLDQAAAIVRGDPIPHPCSRPGMFDIAELLREMRPLLGMICRSKHRLTLTAGPGLPTVSCETVALEAVLQSLVTYACREMPSGGDILLSATKAVGCHGEPGLVVAVRCYRQPGVLARLTGCRNKRDRIGLSIAMRFAHARGGELYVDRPDSERMVIVMQVPGLRGRPR